jgi:hypothetical protein
MGGVYLGNSGMVEIRRRGLNSNMASLLDPADVNVVRKRFSFDFEAGALITGDQLEIRTEDGSTLELVAGHVFPDGRWFCHVDQAGGVRLYDKFEDAINGEEGPALALVAPSRSIPIEARSRNSLYRDVAQVANYEITTSREAVDLTVLGDEHRHHYASGLISGQGTLNCFWNYERVLCDPECDGQVEVAHYFAQLVLRLQQGASFEGRFFIKSQGAQRTGQNNPGSADDMVWWEALCVVTNVAMSFEPTQPIRSQIEFVTTGPVLLKVGQPPGLLLQESRDALLLEKQDGALLLEE